MSLFTRSIYILATLYALYCNKCAEAIDCYICSWSPQDRILEEDRCTTGNFDERRVRYINCHVGCEIVKMLDSNGELLMFYRNCLMSSPSKFDYERSNKKTSIVTEEMYACDYDLCNKATISKNNLMILFLTVSISVLSSQIFRVQ